MKRNKINTGSKNGMYGSKGFGLERSVLICQEKTISFLIKREKNSRKQ